MALCVGDDDCRRFDDTEVVLSSALWQNLFRLFMMFAETCNNKPMLQTRRAVWLLQQMAPDRRCIDIDRLLPSKDLLTFRDFLTAIDAIFTGGDPRDTRLESAADALSQRYIFQIIRKGYVMRKKRTTCLISSSNWQMQWCSVHPGSLQLSPIDANGLPIVGKKIVSLINCDSSSIQIENDEVVGRYIWHISIENKLYTFASLDQLDRTRWCSAILLAITKPKCAQLIAADIERSSTGCCNRQDDSVGDRRQLVNWRFAFETENIRLSQQLEREREAVRDEEIVRNLATRMLDEERNRCAHLEQIVIDQEAQLIRERAYRKQLIIDNADREMELTELRNKFNQQTTINGYHLRQLPANFDDGDRVLQELRRGQQTLIDCRLELQETLRQHREAQLNFAVETGSLLDSLLNKHLRNNVIVQSSNSIASNRSSI